MDLLSFEKELFNKGVTKIAGVDEVGRGPLAGPIVAAAVILDLEYIFNSYSVGESHRNNDVLSEKAELYSQINDSKKLTHVKRTKLSSFIISEAVSYSIFEVSNQDLDRDGLRIATQTLFREAVKSLSIQPEHVLTDHFKIKSLDPKIQTNINQGDARSISIAAASIIAKVYRDALMENMHKMYPGYGFQHNKGYGTREHIEAIKKLGPTEIHRKSFEPLRSLIKSSVI
ncbi:ribonuclease HII [candidate division WWE3 bacterium RIFOXYC1_FULL_39_7]|uniref:Ribonuclease HII n=2 Tax=Katanobacteria TaxID=422282 RepID=A0A1F4X3C9_UNCKA|nr:MAG: ribonuclease HII [candidate division WWE3 bacterium RIFOXYC1_FULL_39_7]OGC76204.1 MAG: ribonuclease HII [candidate division WWE3 bacterium RIFOXYD1_FULL_39_9]